MDLFKTSSWMPNMPAARLKPLLICLCLITVTALQGCALFARAWPPFNRQVITATTEINPDATERPSPVQIKVMQLAQRTTFDNLTFDQLFYEGPLLLNNSLISESSLVLQPGEQVEHTISLQESVTHIAVIAAYRNIDQARWKHVYPIDPYSHATTHIKLDAKGIAATDSFFSKAHAENMNQQDNQAPETSPGVEDSYIVERDYTQETLGTSEPAAEGASGAGANDPTSGASNLNTDTLSPDQLPNPPAAEGALGGEQPIIETPNTPETLSL